MIILVGSRRFGVNSETSDYDLLGCKFSSKNSHELRLVMYNGIKSDYHVYEFENKAKVLEYIKADNSSMTNSCLIYPEFRLFWNITDEELLDTIDLSLLREYEKYYLESQLGKFEFDIYKFKELYDKYKLSIKEVYNGSKTNTD